MPTIYKICTAAEWRAAEHAGVYPRLGGRPAATASSISRPPSRRPRPPRKHFAGQRDLVLVAVDAAALGDRLKWEPSRGGALFPHLYGELRSRRGAQVDPLPLDAAGRHVFPSLDPCGRADES